MELMALQEYRDTVVGTLPYGIRKRVEIAKAVASRPELLLLDEPVAGMNHEETATFVDYVLELKERLGLTVVLIEHDVAMVMRIADRILALDFGEVIGLGTPAEIQQNERVIAAYLGATDESDVQTKLLLEGATSE
jgi:branched-chain amino acid transport system ATP-binding protein